MAYTAQIEIGVKGAEKLRELRRTVEELSTRIKTLDGLADVFEAPIQSVKNFNSTLKTATENLRLAELASTDEAEAIQHYVAALGEANTARARQNSLIDQQIAKQTAANRVVREASTGFSAARYGPQVPTGTGAQGDPEFPSSPVGEKIQRQLQGADDLLKVRRALEQLEQRSISLLEEKLNINQRITNEATLQAQREKTRAEQVSAGLSMRIPTPYRTAGGAGFPVALPEIAQDRKIRQQQAKARLIQQKETNSELVKGVTKLKAQVAIAQQLDGVYDKIVASLVRANERQGQLFRGRQNRQTRKDLGGTNIELLKQINNLSTGRIQKELIKNKLFEAGVKIKNNEFNTVRAIQKEVRGLIGLEDDRIKAAQRLVNFRRNERKEQGKRRKAGQENALIGGAFPLLFGQGLGASAGGALGGFMGGKAGGSLGFGLSLVGTSIGQAFDDATKRVADMGSAIRSLDLSALEGAAIRVSEQLKFQVDQLKEAGDFAKARALVEQTVANQTGSTATVIKDIANSGNLLKVAFDELLASGSVFLGTIAAPFAVLLAGIIKEVANLLKLVNRIFAVIGGLLRQVEQIIDPAGNIAKAIERIAPATAEATAEMKKFNVELQRGLDLALETAGLDLKLARFGPSNTAEDKIDKRRLQLARDLQGIERTINEQRKEAAKLSGADKVTALSKIGLLESTLTRAATLNSLLDITNIKSAEQLRLNKNNEAVEQRRAQLIKQRLQDANKELMAVIEANQAEGRFANFVPPSPIAFDGFTGEQIRDQRIANIEQEKQNQLELLDQQTISQNLKLDKQRTIEAKADLAIAKERANFTLQQRGEQEKIIRATLDANANLDKEIALIQGKLQGKREEVELAMQLNDINKSIGATDREEIENLERKLQLLSDTRKLEAQFDIQQQTKFAGAGLKAGFIGQAGEAFKQTLIDGGTEAEAQNLARLTQEMVLAQTQAQALESAVLGIGNAFATAMTTGVSELIAGTKSAQEVFADFLKNIGDALVSAATQMIATYIAIGIAKAFAGMSGGFNSGAASPGGSAGVAGIGGGGMTNPFGNTSSFGAPVSLRANGGPVSGGQPYLIGERGPEMFVPGQSGGVMSSEDMRSLMGRSPAASNSPAMNFSFETTNFGGTDYVSREQLEAAMAVTRKDAARDGAKRGMNMTLDKMQHSPSTRRRVGI